MRKGKVILGEMVVLVLRASAIWLAKSVVREHLTDAGHVAEIAIEDFAFGLVLVETQGKVVPQVAATLRIPIGQHSGNAWVCSTEGYRIDVPGGILRLVAQERYQVTRGRVAHTEHLGLLCRIPEIVDKTALERCPLGQQLDTARIGIGPAIGRDFCIVIGLFRPYSQPGLRLVQGSRSITE